ncbi:MAG: hypothetical protein HQL63_08485 [Magnetococcales bacterium]|nr:hypothetical protein [Magnetococcales bacterium]MBF0323092.1 hypothetical protein [Magnetococcales bacterium]
MVIEIRDETILYGIIVRYHYDREGVSFFTPDDFSQQLAFMKHPEGRIIKPHFHNRHPREVNYTQEVLFIRKGRLRVDFYNGEQEYFKSYILETGDVLLLTGGGHGFQVLEPLEMIEVKQGPYAGDRDKVVFRGLPPDVLRIEEQS